LPGVGRWNALMRRIIDKIIAGKPKNAAAHALNAPPPACLTG